MSSGFNQNQVLEWVRCPKTLYYSSIGLRKNKPDTSLALKRFDKKKMLQLFMDGYGISVTKESFNPNQHSKNPRYYLNVECTFNLLTSKADLLKIGKNEVEIFVLTGKLFDPEKDESADHFRAALQAYAFYQSQAVSKVWLVYFNLNQGKPRVKKIDVLKKLQEIYFKNVWINLEQMKRLIESKVKPRQPFGIHCGLGSNNPCRFLPNEKPNELLRFKGFGRSLILKGKNIGITSVRHLPESYQYSRQQEIIRKSANRSRPYISKHALKESLQDLGLVDVATAYPMYFLDFETINTAIPLFPSLSGHIPVQYSIHCQAKRGSQLKHSEYLWNGIGSPESQFLDSLMFDLRDLRKDKGSVIVYNAGFESAILKRLQAKYQQYSSQIQTVLDQMADLHVPFRKMAYYKNSQRGSTSLKAVYAALTGKSYNDLVVKNGQMAMQVYLLFHRCNNKTRKAKLRNWLLRYCERDTISMYEILLELWETLPKK